MGNLLDNDIDLEGNSQTVVVTPIIPVNNGIVTIDALGNYTYTPNAGFIGNDAFVYQVCDNGIPSVCDQATVYLTIQPINKAPKAFGDLNATLLNMPITGNVLTNDVEPDGQGLITTTVVLGGPSSGSIILNADGSYVYTPNTGFIGADSLLYIACDDFVPPACDTGILKLTVNEPTQSLILIAHDDYYNTKPNTLLNGRVLDNDVTNGANGFTLNLTILRGVNNGVLTTFPNGTFDYLPNLNYIGEDEFEYKICSADDPTVCDSAIVFICIPEDSPFNEPPFAADDVAITTQNIPVEVDLLDNDFDVDGDNIMLISPITQPSNGTITFTTGGILTYIPDPNYIGPDNFIYEICDDGTPQLCAQGTFYVLVLPQSNTAPVALNDDNVTFVNTMITGRMLTNDFDPEGDSIAVVITPIVDPNNGTVNINPDGSYTYYPNADYVGIDAFEYAVCEVTPNPLCDTAIVNINIIPMGSPNSGMPPMAMNDDNITYVNMPVDGNVLANDLDPEGTTMTVSGVVIQPSKGDVFMTASGDYTYTPDTDFIGNDRFTYLACDGGSPIECVFALVYIEVLPNHMPFADNLPPVATDDFNFTEQDQSVTGRIDENDQDIDNDEITIINVEGITTSPTGNAISLDNGTVNVQPDGEYTYTPNAGFRGTDKFTYEISDGQNRCSRATVYLAVRGEESCIDLQLKVFLEGALSAGHQNYLTEMRTDLNVARSILPGQMPVNPTVSPTPAGQPYAIAPFNYSGTDIENTYAGPYDADVVDWVLVSLRTEMSADTEFRQAAGLLKKDGTITFLEPCVLADSDPQSVYIVVEHRNHLGIMTAAPVTVVNKALVWDFTTQNSYMGIGGFGTKEVMPGTFAMYAGDNDQLNDFPSYDITGTDKILWATENGNFDLYLPSDFDLNGDVNGADKILWSENNGTSSRVPK